MAHERAVLMPGARHASARPCAASSSATEISARLAEVAGRPAPGRRPARTARASRSSASASRSPARRRPSWIHGRPVSSAEARVRLELLVPARRGRLAAALALARTRGRCRAASASAASRGDEAADEQAAVAQDPGAQQLGRELGGGDVGQAVAPPGSACRVRLRERRVVRRVVQQPDAGQVAQPQDPPLGLAGRARRGCARSGAGSRRAAPSVLPSTSKSSASRLPPHASAGTCGSTLRGRAREPRPRSRPPARRRPRPRWRRSSRPSPMRTGPITFAPVPMLTSRSIVGAADVARPQADGHERGDHRARADLDQAVDDDLPVDDVDAGLRPRPGRRSRSARTPSPAGARSAAGPARRAPAAAP